MNSVKMLIPCMYLKNEKLVKGFRDDSIVSDNPIKAFSNISVKGADAVIVFDLSDDDNSHENALLKLRDMNRAADVPMIGAGNIKRLEDVKKLLYAGCKYVALNMAKESNIELIKEASKRFGKNKILVCADAKEQILDNLSTLKEYTSGAILLDSLFLNDFTDVDLIVVKNDGNLDDIKSLLGNNGVSGVSGDIVNNISDELYLVKRDLYNAGISTDIFVSPYDFDDFKKDSSGLVTVVVQDVKTSQVLQVAYMNQEAYEATIATGIMTYYSRSRKCLWVKGETSGHYQYVKSLTADCDLDTILADVVQIGGACHTGSYSCFFNEIAKKECDEVNPYKVFENVFSVILDRKVNPKEGSYTNYLFDKGIDKILKKVGEEATEIVIAAKNPEKEEVKYEIADFLYHVMVLMAECDLTWEDITEELANR